MKLRLAAYGIAREILNGSEMELDMEGKSIADLKNHLIRTYPAFEKLRSLRFAVHEDYQTDDFLLNENDEVVIKITQKMKSDFANLSKIGRVIAFLKIRPGGNLKF